MNKTVLITGATSGIGKATAKAFAKAGYSLIVTGRRLEKLQELKDEISDNAESQIQLLNFDVRDQIACERNLQPIADQVDILINNAGLAKGLSFIHEGDLEDWETMIDTNLKGLLYVTRIISPEMVRKNSGHIINVCSTAGKEIYPKGNVYSATKFAVEALTRSMRADLYTFGIKVSQVAPGHVEETEFAQVRFDGDKSKANIYSDFNPLRASDVADAIFFIASRPPHVNIQDILLMGTQQAGSNWIDRTGRKYDHSK